MDNIFFELNYIRFLFSTSCYKSKFFESYVDYLFDDEKCNFYWNQLEEELHTGLINVINLSLIGEIETGRNITLYIITYIVK